jgi:hypothetical protein
MHQNLLEFPGYVSDIISFLIGYESDIVHSHFISAFFDRLICELFERRLWILVAACACVLPLSAIAIPQKMIPIELPLTIKKKGFEANRDSLMVVEQIPPLFGVEVFLQSYLIESYLAFHLLSKCWPRVLSADRVWAIFVERIGLNLDVTIATFGLYFGFTLHFPGASKGGDPWRSVCDQPHNGLQTLSQLCLILLRSLAP